MYTFQNNLENSRIGITVSKKVGKAVIRNRVKRKIREICRLNLHKIKNGYDIIFVARNAILNKNYHQINDEAKRLFKKAKVIIGE